MPRIFRRTFRMSRHLEDVPRDVQDEIRFHLEMRTQELIEQGLSPEEARQAALKAFGDAGRFEQDSRAVSQQARQARRRSELFGPLRLGAGSPQSDADDRRSLDAFEDVAIFVSRSHSLKLGEAMHNVFSMMVTPSYFRVLNVQPEAGRLFSEDEGQPGRNNSVIISLGLNRELFGEENPLGRLLQVEGRLQTIVGVMPDDFQFADWEARLWLPLAFSEEEKSDAARHRNSFEMIARLGQGATLQEARSQVDAFNAGLAGQLPPHLKSMLDSSGFHTQVHFLHDDLVRDVRPPLLLLWSGALLVLLIGCLSLANLQLVRATGRMRELAARLVLGAGHWRLLRLLWSESLLIALAGGTAGVLLGAWSLNLLGAFEVYQIPRIREVRLDWTAVLFSMGLAFLAGTLSGTLPAAALRRLDMQSAFRIGERASGGRWGGRVRGGLVSLQVAVAFVLLAGAGLMLASLLRVRAVDPGFQPGGVLAAALILPDARYPHPADRRQFLDRAVAEVRALPGVIAAGTASQLPFSGMGSRGPLTPEGFVRNPSESFQAHYRTVVSSGYFEAMGIPILQGRGFDERDQPDSRKVIIVDERVARTYWGDADPVGKRLKVGAMAAEGPWFTVIGVAGEILQNDLTDPSPISAYYLASRQSPNGFMRLAVKSASEPRSLLEPLRRLIAGLDPARRCRKAWTNNCCCAASPCSYWPSSPRCRFSWPPWGCTESSTRTCVSGAGRSASGWRWGAAAGQSTASY